MASCGRSIPANISSWYGRDCALINTLAAKQDDLCALIDGQLHDSSPREVQSLFELYSLLIHLRHNPQTGARYYSLCRLQRHRVNLLPEEVHLRFHVFPLPELRKTHLRSSRSGVLAPKVRGCCSDALRACVFCTESSGSVIHLLRGTRYSSTVQYQLTFGGGWNY